MPGMADPKADQTDQLLGYVAQQRYALRLTAYELTREQATATPTRSKLSIAGILKHTVWAERGWVDMAAGHTRTDQPNYVEHFVLDEGESLDDLFVLQDTVAAETEKTVRDLGLEHTFANPKGAPWFPDHVDEWDVRWMLLHLVEELARHAGHADIIREHLDDRHMGDIIAEVENWTLPDWVYEMRD